MYLLSQIWLFLFLAFGIGLLTGWFFFRRAEGSDGLHDELNAVRTERDDLATRLAAAGSGATVTAQGDAQKIARLEAELAEARVKAASEAEGEDEAITALRWRNKFLESRVKFLEEAPAVSPAPAPVAVEEPAPAEPLGFMAPAAAAPTAAPARTRAAAKPAAPKAAAPKAAAPKAAAPKAAAPKAAAPKAAAPKATAAPKAAPAPAPKAKAEPKPYQMSEAGTMSPDALEAAIEAAGAGRKPRPSRSASGGDDLLLILGVGPKNKTWLNEQGIFYFRQIAQMTIPELAWLSQNLPTFGNRVYRENWVAQCDRLMRGLSPKP